MDALCAKPTAGHVKKALLDLRNSGNRGDKLAFLYEQAMERINSQDEDSRALAHAVLSWTTHAIDPLTGVQLQHALATLFSTSELDRDFMPEIEYLLSICAGLITIDGEGVVHWIHYTTQEHFNRTWEKLLPSGQLDIARTCITYISFEVFASGRTSPKNNRPSHNTDFPLYGYAVRHWGSHLKRGQARSVFPSFIATCNPDTSIAAALPGNILCKGLWNDSSTVPGSTVHVTTHYQQH